jgi:hypothetical protein
MKKVVDFEFVPLNLMENVAVDWEYEEREDELDSLEIHEATIAIATLFEELGLA